MQKIIPRFDDQAQEAVRLYVSIFKNSKMGKTSHYGEGGPRSKGLKKAGLKKAYSGR